MEALSVTAAAPGGASEQPERPIVTVTATVAAVVERVVLVRLLEAERAGGEGGHGDSHGCPAAVLASQPGMDACTAQLQQRASEERRAGSNLRRRPL